MLGESLHVGGAEICPACKFVYVSPYLATDWRPVRVFGVFAKCATVEGLNGRKNQMMIGWIESRTLDRKRNIEATHTGKRPLQLQVRTQVFLLSAIVPPPFVVCMVSTPEFFPNKNGINSLTDEFSSRRQTNLFVLHLISSLFRTRALPSLPPTPW